MPPFRFFLSEDRTEVGPGSPHRDRPLPTHRAAAADAGDSTPPLNGEPVTYGAYFRALAEALGTDRCRPLREALGRLAGASPERIDIRAVAIHLLKHGHFYHPSKVVVQTEAAGHRLALNAALGADGIALLPRETAALRHLEEQEGDLGVPRVLAQGRSSLSGDRDCLWFLSPWFEGFHEFHLTRRGAGEAAVIVWDGAERPTRLDDGQAAALLSGAGCLLASAIDPHSLAHIFPWHHAAGDFVVHLDAGGRPAVRLITVRGYPPLLPPPDADGDPDASLERLLYALLLFVVQAALRLRVDRLDGVGELVLHPAATVVPICRGLLDGLAEMRRRWGLPAELDRVVRGYLASLSLAELQSLNQTLQGGFAPGSPERVACAPFLEPHGEALYDCLQSDWCH